MNKLYTVYHEDNQKKEFEKYCPENIDILEPGERVWYNVNDNIGINYMNKVWSELVCLWYVWKYEQPVDYIGFNHYHRLLKIDKLPKDNEIQIYQIIDLLIERKKYCTIYTDYCKCHYYKDIDIIIHILTKKFGKNNCYTNYIFNNHKMIGNCCFFTKYENFINLCNFLFPIIDEYSEMIGCYRDLDLWKKYSEQEFGTLYDYQLRAVSFFGERLISAWFVCNNFKVYSNNLY